MKLCKEPSSRKRADVSCQQLMAVLSQSKLGLSFGCIESLIFER